MRSSAYLLSIVFVLSSCHSPSTSSPTTDVGADAPQDAAHDTAPDAKICAQMFGVPSERTGLTADACGPSCTCDDLVAVELAEADLANLRAWQLAAPLAELVEDPYDSEPPPASDDVCVAEFDAATGVYALTTQPAGFTDTPTAVVTHRGACGLCSTLHDLAAYAQTADLTEPVRQCGLDGIRDGAEANIACLEALGFTRPCAQIWYYNTLNTRTACLEPCFAALRDPYHLPDGSLNECLACDESESGATFKAFAGRTRRNRGLSRIEYTHAERVAVLIACAKRHDRGGGQTEFGGALREDFALKTKGIDARGNYRLIDSDVVQNKQSKRSIGIVKENLLGETGDGRCALAG